MKWNKWIAGTLSGTILAASVGFFNDFTWMNNNLMLTGSAEAFEPVDDVPQEENIRLRTDKGWSEFSTLAYVNAVSSNDAIAKVEITNNAHSVSIYGLKPGKADITITMENGQVRIIHVTVAIDFEWGKSNWNFVNSEEYFKDSTRTYRTMISQSYLEMLESNLQGTEWETIFRGYVHNELTDTWHGAWLSYKWGGSCYGMSALMFLANRGLIPYSDYQSGAKSLSELPSPAENYKISSLITYYHMLQVRTCINQERRKGLMLSNEETITKLISLLNHNGTVFVGYFQPEWGGHAVVAYDYSYGSWQWEGRTYDGCICIADPNESEYDEAFNIYFNSKTFDWIIPRYHGGDDKVVSSLNGAKIDTVIVDANYINDGGCLSGTKPVPRGTSFIARMDTNAIADNHAVSKVKKVNGVYLPQETVKEDIVANVMYTYCGDENDGVFGYNLSDSASAYCVEQDTPDTIQLSMDYENCTLRAGSDEGTRVIFDRDGVVEVDSASANYNISMTFNEDYPTDWFSFNITGENADTVVMEKADDGYILRADNLQNVYVDANNREDSSAVCFTTDCDEVFLYEIDPSTIGVAIDTDDDGTYETVVAQSGKIVTYGDINLDGKCSIIDAVFLQKYLLSNKSVSKYRYEAADLNEDGFVDVFDLALLKREMFGN